MFFVFFAGRLPRSKFSHTGPMLKPFATNFTNIPPSYAFMFYTGAIVFTFFDIPSSICIKELLILKRICNSLHNTVTANKMERMGKN
jgi:hypothetical protein